MITAGFDGRIKLWDIRTYKNIYEQKVYPIADCLDISQLGLLAIGGGNTVKVN